MWQFDAENAANLFDSDLRLQYSLRNLSVHRDYSPTKLLTRLSLNHPVGFWERTRPACCRRRRAVGLLPPRIVPPVPSAQLRPEFGQHQRPSASPLSVPGHLDLELDGRRVGGLGEKRHSQHCERHWATQNANTVFNGFMFYWFLFFVCFVCGVDSLGTSRSSSFPP